MLSHAAIMAHKEWGRTSPDIRPRFPGDPGEFRAPSLWVLIAAMDASLWGILVDPMEGWKWIRK